MRTQSIYLSVTLLLILLVFSACAQAAPATAELPVPSVVQSSLADSPTVPPSLTPTRKSTSTPTNPPPTNTLMPTDTVSPTPACTNKAEFVKHLTVGDHTVLKPGEYFAKIWQIMNVGTCTWTQEYSLVFVNGEIMNGPQAVPLPQVVLPGEMVDLRVDLVAPSELDAHSGDWMLQDVSGNLFGIGESGDQAIAVNIVIKPTPWPTPS